MKGVQKPIRTMLSLAVIGMMANQTANAGAFSLYTESSAAAIGNYAAGIGAEGADASIGWYNPAGLVLIKEQQALLSGVGVLPSNLITGTSSFYTDMVPAPYVQSFNQLQGAKNAVVPAFHYAQPLGERAAFGLSIVSPYGLSSSWKPTSAVRYSGTYTELLSMNVAPELAGKLTENFSVGAGLDLQWSQVRFNSMVGSPAQLQELGNPFVSPSFLDTRSNNTGRSFGVGFHVGMLGMFNENHTRVGLSYLSKMGHTYQGTSEFKGPLADPIDLTPSAAFISPGLMSNDVQFPDVLTLSGYQDVNSKLALLGSVVYTGWSCFEKIQLNNVAAISPEFDLGTVNVESTEGYRDTFRFAVGANYHVNDRWMMRIGGGFDQTPTTDIDRDIRLPDVDRFALAIGAHYQMWPTVGFDVGYSYLFGANNKSPINKTTAIGTTSSNTINATANDNAQLVGLQVVWYIDKKEAAPSK